MFIEMIIQNSKSILSNFSYFLLMILKYFSITVIGAKLALQTRYLLCRKFTSLC